MAEVVVVGAGVVGASIAFHLAETGIGVTVLDREGPAAGATARSGGIVSYFEDTAAEAALAWDSLTGYFERWHERVGGGCGFTTTGAATLADDTDAAALRTVTTMQRDEAGIDAELIDPDTLAAREPAARFGDVSLAAYQPRSGYADPSATTISLLRAGRTLGVRFERRQVTGLVERSGRTAGVATDSGMIEADAVVLAAGAWSVPIAATAGVELAVRPTRIQVMLYERPYSIPMHLTMADAINDLYIRSTADRCTLAGRDAPRREWLDDPDEYRHELDADAIDDVSSRLTRRIPDLAGAPYRLGRTAVLDMTPDGKPILGPLGPAGLHAAVGWSGNGFGKAPAVGAEIAHWVVDGTPRREGLTAYGPGRFADNAPIAGEGAFAGTATRLGQ